MAITSLESEVLSEELIQPCGERAPIDGRENRFYQEGFDKPIKADYRLLSVPKELGGRGTNLTQVCQEQRPLAYRAPATAVVQDGEDRSFVRSHNRSKDRPVSTFHRRPQGSPGQCDPGAGPSWFAGCH